MGHRQRPPQHRPLVNDYVDTYDEMRDNQIANSLPYQTVTNNAVGGAMGTGMEMIANGRQIAIATGSRTAETVGRLGTTSRISQAAVQGRPGFDPAMSGRNVRQTELGASIGGMQGRVMNGALGVIGMQQGTDQFFDGLHQWDEASDADGRVNAGLTMAGGATGAGSAAIGVAGALGSEAAVAGTAAAGMGTAVGAAGAIPVVGAVWGGAATGLATAARGQQYARENALLGTDRDGTARDWSDAAAATGASADAWVAQHTGSSTLGTAAGLYTTGVTSVGAAAGAGLTGIGGLVNDMGGNDMVRRHGVLGHNRDGSNRDWADAAADAGVSADRAVARRTGSAALGTAAGLATTAGASVVGAAGNAVSGGANLAMTAGNPGNRFAREHGILGQTADGHNRDWGEAAADAGVAADRWVAGHTHNETLGTIAGVGTTAAASVVGAAGNAITGAASLATDAGHSISSGARRAWNWLND